MFAFMSFANVMRYEVCIVHSSTGYRNDMLHRECLSQYMRSWGYSRVCTCYSSKGSATIQKLDGILLELELLDLPAGRLGESLRWSKEENVLRN